MRAAVLAANATRGVGGQGANLEMMAEVLRPAFGLTVFARADYPGLPTVAVPEPRLAGALRRVPFARRARDVLTDLEDAHFDRAVAARLGRPALFQGATGQCLRSLEAARAAGARTALDVVTPHIDALGAAMDRTCAGFGVRPPLGPGWRARAATEYGRADLIRVMSGGARRSFLERGADPARVVLVPPYLDVGDRVPVTATPERFRVSFVGLLEPWKGFHDLVEAFIAARLPDAELVLWGGPGTRPVSRYLNAVTARHAAITVRAAGVRDGGFADVYGTSAVLVHPSYADGYGLVVAEALACGVPVLASRETGAADLVRDGVNGFVFAAGDRGALAERLRHLYDHPADRAAMAAAAPGSVAHLTRDAMRAAWIPRLQELLA